MAETVDDLRNEIRTAVGRFEREISAAFTKEDLAAICEAVGHEIDRERLPSKSEMRAGILENVDAAGGPGEDEADRPFRKGELRTIADALDAE